LEKARLLTKGGGIPMIFRSQIAAALLCGVAAMASVAEAGSYAEEMSKAVKKAFGSRISGLSREQQQALVWLTYPTDNFGVGTTSILRSPHDDPRDADFNCSPSLCLGRQAEPSAKALDLYGYASYGSGPPVDVNEKSQRSIAIGALANGIAGVLGVDLGFSKDRSTTYRVSIGKAFVRQLEKEKYAAYLTDSLSAGSSRRTAYQEGRLVLFDADVIVDGFVVDITINTRTYAHVAARLNSLSQAGGAKDSLLGVQVSKNNTSEGTYQIRASSPLVVAVAPFRQKAKGMLQITSEYEWVQSPMPRWARRNSSSRVTDALRQ
jgi:hypothetical protein